MWVMPHSLVPAFPAVFCFQRFRLSNTTGMTVCGWPAKKDAGTTIINERGITNAEQKRGCAPWNPKLLTVYYSCCLFPNSCWGVTQAVV